MLRHLPASDLERWMDLTPNRKILRSLWNPFNEMCRGVELSQRRITMVHQKMPQWLLLAC